MEGGVMERLKLALEFDKCCFCVDLRTGSLLIGYYNLFWNFLTIHLFLLSWLISNFEKLMMKKPGMDTYTRTVFIVVIVCSIMYIPVTVICLIGLHRNISHYINVYLLYTLIYIVVTILLFIASFMTDHADIGFLIWDILSIGLYIYFYLVVRSFYLAIMSPSAK